MDMIVPQRTYNMDKNLKSAARNTAVTFKN